MCYRSFAPGIDPGNCVIVSVWSNAIGNEINGYAETQEKAYAQAEGYLQKNFTAPNRKIDSIIAVIERKNYHKKRIPKAKWEVKAPESGLGQE